MKDGKYIVQSYNGKDAVLIGEDGTFEVMTKTEFPKSFGGLVYVGENIIAETVQTIHPEFKIDEERERTGHANYTREFCRLKDLEQREAARRALYIGANTRNQS